MQIHPLIQFSRLFCLVHQTMRWLDCSRFEATENAGLESRSSFPVRRAVHNYSGRTSMLHISGSSAGKTKTQRNRFLVWSVTSAVAFLAVPLTLFALNPPGSNFNLSYWDLETPVGNGSPMIVSSSQLQNGFVNGAYFFTNSSDGSMVMKEPGTNCTAWSGTHCRTEFREVSPSNGQYTSWSSSGTNK